MTDNPIEQFEQFTEELKQFCLERGFEIAGTCSSEGIYGEIVVRRVGPETSTDWKDWDKNKFNFER